MVWRKMQAHFLTDEAMSKKNDDLEASVGRSGGLRKSNTWSAARVPQKRSFKRICAAAALFVGVYLFIHYMPTNIGPRRSLRPVYGVPGSTAGHRPPSKQPPEYSSESKTQNQGSSPPERTYNGPPRFLNLGVSLRAIGATHGTMTINRNVLFAASNLRSATALLPVACQMGTELRNYVHFAFMGRSEIEMEDLRKLNGIDEDCQVIIHDARPVYAPISTDERMETSLFRAFCKFWVQPLEMLKWFISYFEDHINTYMHPQAIIIDGSRQEDNFFHRGARSQARASGNTLIELPERSAKSLSWITKLDSSSLKVWDKIHINILVQAIPGASGSLIRLLKSLSKADYTGSSIPHLTMELPHDIDPPTKRYLETFKWPPEYYNPTHARYLSLRHRIPRQTVTEEQSSTRFLESFWPADPQHSHVLVLSPKVELSPEYFHYLRYYMLEYKYSTTSRVPRWDEHLLAISLEQPLFQLNGKDKFSPPMRLDDSGEQSATSFLWQAPTSNAVLIMGDKWVELHDFMSRSFDVQTKSDSTAALLSDKMVSTSHPAWLEHVLRLSRLRGYLTIYPGEDIARNLATVHGELHHLPEEYAKVDDTQELLADGATEAEIEKAIQRFKPEAEIQLASVSLLQGLPNDGNLVLLGQYPILTWDGEKTDFDEVEYSAAEYAKDFKEKVGGCSHDEAKVKRVPLSTEDLFCSTS